MDEKPETILHTNTHIHIYISSSSTKKLRQDKYFILFNKRKMETTTTATTRKLRPLVITLGSERKSHIESLFNEPCMKQHFEQPIFSSGIPSRELRGCYSFLKHASNTGIIPQHEWDAILKAKQEKAKQDLNLNDDEKKRNEDIDDNHLLLDCLNDVPVLEGRRV